MLYIFAITLGILLGLAFKGRISNLLSFKFEKIWLFICAFTVLIAAQAAGSKFEAIKNNMAIIHAIVFCLLLAGFWFNRNYTGILAIGFGCFLNALVIMLNGGKMPVSIEIVKQAGLPVDIINTDVRHLFFNKGNDIKLDFLADIIHMPGIFGYGMRVVSAGDLIIVLGLFLIMFQVVKGKEIAIFKSSKS